MRLPHVWCCVLRESVPSTGPKEFESALAVGCNSDTSAYFTKGVCGFVNLDIDMVVLEETKR